MNLTDRAEEILEALWIELIEKHSDECDVGLLRDDEILDELKKMNLVEVKNELITLTSRGQEEAKNCVRRHRLAERLLADILDVKKKLLHETSCKFEHLLHRGLDENICTLLGHPKTCPHGSKIPEGQCCKETKNISEKVIMPLSDLDRNKKAKVSYLQTNNKEALQKIIAMGVLPKTDLKLIQRTPSVVFQIGKGQFAIDRELASNIYVRIV